MGRICCISGCKMRSHDHKGNLMAHGLSFFVVPAWKKTAGEQVSEISKRRRLAWIAAVKRPDLKLSPVTRKLLLVCSRHFISGKPAYEMDETNPDWVPSLLLGHSEVRASQSGRYERRRKKKKGRGQEMRGIQSGAAEPEVEAVAGSLLYLQCLGMNSKKRRICSRKDGFTFQRAQSVSRHHCCVPLCTAGGKYNTILSFHSFPKDPDLRAQWLAEIRRKEVQKSSKVCSRHFAAGHIVVAKSGNRCLRPKSVPSLFHWNNYWSKTLDAEDEPVSGCTALTPAFTSNTEDHNYSAASFIHTFGLQRFVSSPEDIQYHTGFPSYKRLMAFWSVIEETTSRILRVTRGRKNLSTSAESPENEPTLKLLPIDEFFLFLNYLATGSTERDLSDKFKIHRSAVSGIIVTWANVLYALLGSSSIRTAADNVNVTCPTVFNGTHRNTKVVLNFIELRCQTPFSLLLQSTYKALVGMSSHGALTFVSRLFQNSISDKEMLRHSGITALLSPEIDTMLDKGFLIEELVPGKVHRLLFLSTQTRMSEEDVLRTHGERLIRRIQGNKLFETVIPLSVCGNINQIFTVACLLTNYQCIADP